MEQEQNIFHMDFLGICKKHKIMCNIYKEWVGELYFDSLDKCATSINLNTSNSGWYSPTITRISGLTGMYLVNQDGSIFYDSRIIKEDEKKYRVETLTSEGFNQFENHYREIMNAAN